MTASARAFQRCVARACIEMACVGMANIVARVACLRNVEVRHGTLVRDDEAKPVGRSCLHGADVRHRNIADIDPAYALVRDLPVVAARHDLLKELDALTFFFLRIFFFSEHADGERRGTTADPEGQHRKGLDETHL